MVDPDSGRSLPEGEIGTLCVTPYGPITPRPSSLEFGRSGQLRARSAGSGTFADLYPMIRHAPGFFKIRSVNVNRAEFEDFMFRKPEVLDFQAVLETEVATGREGLKVLIEIKGAIDEALVCANVRGEHQQTFEVSPLVEVLKRGTLATEFERSLKAPRFVDRRQ